MLRVKIKNLQPSTTILTGALTGDAHFERIRSLALEAKLTDGDGVILDFEGIECASASYLKRLLNPFYPLQGRENRFGCEIAPVLINVGSPDLREDIQDYSEGKNRAIVVAEERSGKLRYGSLVGRLERAAEETLRELHSLGQATALQLYQLFPTRTTNQTAWNNRLVQLVELRIARRKRDGRIWKYEPILTT